MTDLRLNGPPELVAAAFEAIKTVIPGIYDERHYEARDGSGDFVEGERVEYKSGHKFHKAVVWRPVE